MADGTQYPDFDYVVGPGGETGQWLKPAVNHGAFYDYGTWQALEPAEGVADMTVLNEGTDEFYDQFSVRKDSNGTVFTRGVLVASFDDIADQFADGGAFLSMADVLSGWGLYVDLYGQFPTRNNTVTP